MMGEDRYLLCQAGRYHIAIAAARRIWEADSPDPSYAVKPIDLRALLDNAYAGAGIAVAFQMSDAAGVLLVDTVTRMAHIADDEFVPLPELFGFARHFFDAACRHAIGGGHPLRLRHQPDFTSPL